MAVSIHTPSGNINTVLGIETHTLSGCLNTTEIEDHIHTPSGFINTVPINLTRMFGNNLNASAINKYRNMFGDDYHIVAIW